MIENVNFHLLLKTAEENYETGKVDYIIEFMNKFIKKMNVDFDFSFLIGIEMGNIGGCASPCDTGDPHLYIGIDKPLDKEEIGMLISHELYHMLRAYMTQESTADTVFTRMVEEGLASYSSLWAHDMEWNTVNIAKTLCVSEKQANNLLNNTNALLERIVNDGEKPISVETMTEYFIADMIGMNVLTEDGEIFGTLKDVIETGANDVYIINSKKHGEVLVPAIKECILDVNVKEGKMLVHLMDGLID